MQQSARKPAWTLLLSFGARPLMRGVGPLRVMNVILWSLKED